ncbi:AAA family ATPase [Leptospira sp. 96542]|nr:AAA family ATPase [Leptospira sp. 96542]
MFSIGNFTAKTELHLGKRSSVYRGESDSGLPVIIKLLSRDYPEIQEINRFRNEFEILNSFHSEYIVQPLQMENYNNSIAIIFPDVGGEVLTKTVGYARPNSIKFFLSVAIRITKALRDIHAAKIVHNDIKSQNIIYNPKTEALHIIDFGSATLLIHRNSFIPVNSTLYGTLAHISPEQTGRMNRAVDYRTDFYSLGVTFYQMVTGELPFIYIDPLEMVHAHIAKTPLTPRERSGAPEIISKLIMKLLEKNPEDRYQTAEGLLYDLEFLESVLKESGSEEFDQIKFKIAERDFSSKFKLPKKLYGRNKELKLFEERFLAAAAGNLEVMLVSGRSGIGKSALINEIRKPVTQYKGYFTSGKFDIYKKAIPFRAITLSFQQLIQQFLTESESSVNLWKAKLDQSLGSNAKLVYDIVPDLEKLLGKQSAPIGLDPQETENRFLITFRNFLRSLCTVDHPITIFLDDMQWADNSSVQLLRFILTDPEIKYLYVVLSYRDNEVLPTDPFYQLLDELKEKQISISEIFLNPLDTNEISKLVSDTLSVTTEEAKPVASVIYKKTKGNPFHVNEVFKSLYDKEYITFNGRKWIWDSEKITSVNISENVIDLIIEKIKIQPPELIEALKLMSCIGNWFRHDIYATIAEISFHKANMHLISLANEEFILLGMEDANFIHDKIKEAVYQIIDPEEKSRLHYKIGRTYLSILYKYKLDDHLFTIVNQLNLGVKQIISAAERQELKVLNERAGQKALSSSANDAAFEFFNRTIELLPTDSWEEDYDETLKVYLNRARSAYLSKNFSVAEETFNSILENARTDLDKIQVYELQSSMFVTQNKMIEVLNTLKQALSILGVHLPKKSTKLSPLSEVIKFKWRFGNKLPNSLVDLPVSTDRSYLAIMRLLNACIAPSFLAEPDLFPVIVLKMVNYTLRYGICEVSAFGFAAFGMIQGSGFGNYNLGLKFGELAVYLLQKFESKTFQCRTLFLFVCMISHWKYHAKKGTRIFWDSFQSGIETGDLQYAAYSLNNLHFQALLKRDNLDELYKSQIKYDSSMLSLKQHHAYQVYRLNLQYVTNLRGETENPLLLNGKYFSESETVKEWLDSKNANALFDYYLCKLRLEYFLGDLGEALHYADLLVPIEGAMFGMMFVPEYIFFSSLVFYQLIQLGKLDHKSISKRKKLFLKNLNRMKLWAKNCPPNYSHKFHILNALLFRLQGNHQKAIEECKKAISFAKEFGYLLEEAIANEFASSFWRELNEDQYSNLHLVEAHYRYGKYGFIPKVKKLENEFIALKKYAGRNFRTDSTDNFGIMSTTKDAFGSTGSVLDIGTVIKASQTISGEIHLNRLLEKMMKILIENAGAERGFFILKSDTEWKILAEGDAGRGKITILSDQPRILNFNEKIAERGTYELSLQIVSYVQRTGSVVILGNASNEGIFVNDPYIKEVKPKSLLCYPIMNHGEVVGIVYLENNLTTDTFTPGRVEILKILSAQIAVSIENSFLYSNLENKVNERTKELNEALTEVKGLKEQQDGDYFLASLLIEPLTQNHADSEYLKIDFLTEQKKKFRYKQWESEIGGDLCVSSSIVLKGKKYVVILNGDAMGKSMQGASGALVIGSVFEAIIKRNIESKDTHDLTPEKWVSNAYFELHYTLTTFDGSMLISMFLCLIDDQTGFLYFLNAEHPRPVIYRNEQNFFLPHKYVCAKLGLLVSKKELQINTFQLESNDVLLIGSDGRDDILLFNDENEEIINEDEELFLKTSLEGKGILPKIRDAIKERGTLIDDLSLIRIEYFGKGSEIQIKEGDFGHSYYVQALLLFKKKKWIEVLSILETNFKILEEAPLPFQKIYLYTKHELFDFPLDFALKYVAKNPSDTLSMYYIAETLSMRGEAAKAYEFSERVRLRRPYHKLNNQLFARLIGAKKT